MGRKKRKGAQLKPFCYYCDREFDDEKVLIQHQKAKHFKCSQCNRKLDTATGLVVHMLQVHKETVNRVPNADPGRDSPEEIVHGMAGVPQEMINQRQAKLDEERGAVKQQKSAHTVFGMSVMSGFFTQMNAAAAAAAATGKPPVFTPGQAAPFGFGRFAPQLAGAPAAIPQAVAPSIITPNPVTPAFTLSQDQPTSTPASSTLHGKVDQSLSAALQLNRGALKAYSPVDDEISPEELLAEQYGYLIERSHENFAEGVMAK